LFVALEGELKGEVIEFPLENVQKQFVIGQNVKVINGRFVGETGLIVQVHDNIIEVFFKFYKHSFQSFGTRHSRMHRNK